MRRQKIGKTNYQFNVWDLAGDQNYIEVRNEFYKESQALLIMFDVTRKNTFDAMDMWLREVSKNGGENLPVFVIGNKIDRADRKIQKSDAEKWVKQRSFAGYFETSPKDGNGYLALFSAIAEQLGSN
jgi:small GTP-binding protein